MPVIVTKSIQFRVDHVHARRIRCVHCRTAFAFAHAGTFVAQSTGLPLLSPDERLRRDALRKVFDRLRGAANNPDAGVARCPTCNRAQPWMVRATIAHYVLTIGIALCILGAGTASFVAMAQNAAVGPAAAWGAAAGALLGSAIGSFLAARQLRGPAPDARSLDDAGLQRLLVQCRRDGSDPVRVWWHQIVGKRAPRPSDMAVSLGISDELGGADIPDEWRTTSILQEISRARPLSSRR